MLTTRSAIETFQRCPRRRFLEYHYQGRGIVPAEPYAPFSVGLAVHRGIELLLSGQNVEQAVEKALERFPDDLNGYQPGEQKALSEALIRVANYCVVPWILSEYEVISVEEEEVLELTPDIVLLGRCDAVVRNKTDGSITIINFKTTSSSPISDSRSESAIYHTLQGVTESILVERRLERRKQSLSATVSLLSECRDRLQLSGFHNLKSFCEKIHDHIVQLMDRYSTYVRSVRFVYLIKGISKWQTDQEGNKLYRVTYSPLIRAYQNSQGEFAHTYNLPDGKRLGRDWKPINVWESIGIKKWIEMLINNEVQPELGDVLKRQVIIPYESYTKDWETKEVLDMIIDQETRILNMLESGMDAFPMYRHSCDYPTTCPYQPICYGRDVDPLESGRYKFREPHHELERAIYAENDDSVR